MKGHLQPGKKLTPALASARLALLQGWMEKHGLTAYLLPLADEYLNEYLPAVSRRLEWLTGFTGSAGMALILADNHNHAKMPVHFFTDGRYTLQAASEMDGSLFTIHNSMEVPVDGWLAAALGAGSKLGLDARLFTAKSYARIESSMKAGGVALASIKENPVDLFWENRPAAPSAKVHVHLLEYAGISHNEKRAALAASLKAQGLDAALITACDSTMWLLNIRGRDVPMTPFALCFSLLENDGTVSLFIDEKKLDDDVRAHLADGVKIYPPESLEVSLMALSGKRVLFDENLSSAWFAEKLYEAGAAIVHGADPCQLPKACKNAVELAGTRKAHRSDGKAVAGFLDWLQGARSENKQLSELDVVRELENFRRRNTDYQGPSFDTISGSGPNGAIVHYRADETSNRTLDEHTFLLLDSGGQYLYGTTDITRTIALGNVTQSMKENYTRVLKGHIALASAVFPRGTSGQQLDVLARQYLWAAGKDYDHGTGHGVGSFLSVHEGPQRIGKTGQGVKLEVGMILSNEPGYYEAGAYGIRIESLVAVRDASLPGFLCFETLTLVPIDETPIAFEMLNEAEKEWLRHYNAASKSNALD